MINKKRVPIRLSMVSDILEGTTRWSKRGVPHIVVGTDGHYGSICYFKNTGIWKFFFPYPSGSDGQTIIPFYSTTELIKYVREFLRG